MAVLPGGGEGRAVGADRQGVERRVADLDPADGPAREHVPHLDGAALAGAEQRPAVGRERHRLDAALARRAGGREHLPVSASHRRMVRSSAAEASIPPSGR